MGQCARLGAYRHPAIVHVFFWGVEHKRGARRHARPSPPPNPLFFIVFFLRPFSVRFRPPSTPRAARPRPSSPQPHHLTHTARQCTSPPLLHTLSTSTSDRETTAATPAAMKPSPNHPRQPPPAARHTAAHHAKRGTGGPAKRRVKHKVEMLHLTRKSSKGSAHRAHVPSPGTPARDRLQRDPRGSLPPLELVTAPQPNRSQHSPRNRVQTPTRDQQTRSEAHHAIRSTHTQYNTKEQGALASHQRKKEKETKT